MVSDLTVASDSNFPIFFSYILRPNSQLLKKSSDQICLNRPKFFASKKYFKQSWIGFDDYLNIYQKKDRYEKNHSILYSNPS